jgi:membrane fusion protein (multidrug efflux system)
VPEGDVAYVKSGAPIEFRVVAHGNDTRYRGSIRYIGPAVRQQSRDAVVEAVVDNPAHELRPGMFVTAEVALGEQSLPAVPRSALRNDGGQQRLFVAVAGRLEERVVQVADARGGGLVPVVNGVKVGEPVVETVTPDVRDGARVK